MNLKKLLLCAPLLLSSHAWASVTEYCPSPSDIQELAAGVYKAPTAGGNGEWYGVSQNGKGPVGEFDVAIFKPHGNVEGNTATGEILRCSYSLQSGGVVDMKFKREGTVATIEVKEPWQEWYSQYYCESKEARACQFKEIVRTAQR
jgi:hypothetical protein